MNCINDIVKINYIELKTKENISNVIEEILLEKTFLWNYKNKDIYNLDEECPIPYEIECPFTYDDYNNLFPLQQLKII